MQKNYRDNCYTPEKWMKDHKGMQGSEYFEDAGTKSKLERLWFKGVEQLANLQAEFLAVGLSKQWSNRWIEMPSMYKVLITSSEWENFFTQRCDSSSQDEIHDFANKVRKAMDESTPKMLEEGEWHIPFGDMMNMDKITDIIDESGTMPLELFKRDFEEAQRKIATARCARISYNNFEGKDDYSSDIRLYDMLKNKGHFSPFEHCARAMSDIEAEAFTRTHLSKEGKKITEKGWCRNIRGFRQLRDLI
jgi:hypothetical protein